MALYSRKPAWQVEHFFATSGLMFCSKETLPAGTTQPSGPLSGSHVLAVSSHPACWQLSKTKPFSPWAHCFDRTEPSEAPPHASSGGFIGAGVSCGARGVTTVGPCFVSEHPTMARPIEASMHTTIISLVVIGHFSLHNRTPRVQTLEVQLCFVFRYVEVSHTANVKING